MDQIFRLLSIAKGRRVFTACFSNYQKLFPMDIGPEKTIDLRGYRASYEAEKDFSIKNPIKLFDRWFNVARNTESIKEANAMAIATSDKSGKPSVRYVLLKGYGEEGFTFYTNYESRKGRQIAENPQVALLFYWESLCRQIRIEGSIVKISEKESDECFYMRPLESQMSAIASNQSEVIENKEVLLLRKEKLKEEYATSGVLRRPICWGGYRVIPDSFEFWCGRTDRLHDRIRFRKPILDEKPDEKSTHTGEDGWIYEYLSP